MKYLSILLFFVFGIAVSLIAYSISERGMISVLVGLAFYLIYTFFLALIKYLEAKSIMEAFSEYSKSVEVCTELARSVEPSKRGLVVHKRRKFFCRVSADKQGLYLYKLWSVSMLLPWTEILLGNQVDGRIAVSPKRSNEFGNLMIPWSTELDSVRRALSN